MRGLEGTVPSARRARRHYGVEVIRPFRSNIDPEYLADTSPWDKSKLCLNRVHWFVEKVASTCTARGYAPANMIH